MNNKVLVGGLIGGVVSFLLGWLIYGMALHDTLADNMMAGINRPETEYQWAFLVLGSLFGGLLYAWVLNKANANSFGSGATTGAVLALLIGLSFAFSMYGVSNLYTTLTGVFVDIVASTVIGLIIGGIIGWWYGRGRPAVVA